MGVTVNSMATMRKWGRYSYDVDWIRQNWDGQHFKALCLEYNRVYGTDIPRHVFQHFCKIVLGLRSSGRYYSETEKEWLRSFYPGHGVEETADAFRERFGKDVKADSLKSYCNRSLGVFTTKDVKYRNHRAEIGSIHHLPGRKEIRIKTVNGWKNLANTLVDVPKGYAAIHLDRDYTNNAPENIAVVKNGYMALMRNNGLWSEHPEITKTSIIWCQLYEALKYSEQRG
jgi:hypothetical protein